MREAAERDAAVDVAKGFGISFVVAGHCGVSILGINVYAFHMPLFFFISGYLFRPKPVSRFVAARAKSLVAPLYVYIWLYAAVYWLTLRLGLFPPPAKPLDWPHALFVDPFLTAHNIPFMNPMWFVSCLFLSSVLFNLFLRLAGDVAWLNAGLGALLAVAATQGPNGETPGAYAARTVMAFAWLCLGRSFRSLKGVTSESVWLAAAAAVFFLANVYTPSTGFLMAWNSYYGAAFSPLLLGLSGSVATVLLSRHIGGRLRTLLVGLGRESFHIMANHLFVIFLFGLLVSLLMWDRTWFTMIYDLPREGMSVFAFAAGLLVPWFAASRMRAHGAGFRTGDEAERNILGATRC